MRWTASNARAGANESVRKACISVTRKAIISTAELKRMAEVANSEGVTVEIERDGAIVRVMPFQPPQVQKMSRAEAGEAELARWMANNEIRKQREAEKAERLRLKATKQ